MLAVERNYTSRLTSSILLWTTGLLILLQAIWVVDARAQPLETAVQAFDEGNELYRTGNYRGAVDAYEAAVAGGYTSEGLFYNLGNAYYRLDQFGQAIRYYEKARLLAPENQELLHNLEIVEAQIVDKFSQLPEPALVAWWDTMVARNGGRWLFWIGFLFYLLAIGLVVYRIKSPQRNEWLRRGMSVAILLGIVFLAAAFWASKQSVETMRAVILSEEIELREMPDAQSNTELRIHEGLVVDVLQQNDVWLEVRIPNGTTGWVPADVVGEI